MATDTLDVFWRFPLHFKDQEIKMLWDCGIALSWNSETPGYYSGATIINEDVIQAIKQSKEDRMNISLTFISNLLLKQLASRKRMDNATDNFDFDL